PYRAPRVRRYLTLAGTTVLSFVLVVWTLLPIYNMILISLEPEGDVFTDHIWPRMASGESFWGVLTQGHWYLEHFWRQFANSLYMGAWVTFLTLAIGTLTAFSIGRMRIRHGWLVSNAALMTYVIPATFLAIPFYRIMQNYGMANNLWSVIAALVAFATPYAFFVFQEYGRSIPIEVDESAGIDGTLPPHNDLRTYMPLSASVVATGYACRSSSSELRGWRPTLYWVTHDSRGFPHAFLSGARARRRRGSAGFPGWCRGAHALAGQASHLEGGLDRDRRARAPA